MESSVLNLSKTIANFLADGGLVLSALFMPEPISLSLNWGLGISIAGVALLVWEHGYSEKPPLIVGPYRFVRNPHSLALWLLSFAMAIAARSFPAVILILVLLPWLFYLEHEELGKRPDARLLRYRFHVPALIPTLMPFDESPNAGFSWRRAVRINKWPSLARLLSVAIVWVYLLVTYSLKLPWWAGLITAGAYIAIKLFLSQRNLRQISFRKKDLISSNLS
ncbi:MAG: hypothetical protein H7318_20060 [Oligoflexus sp.]|nr:hypothetical protein [Oligoflexus sp.]